MTDSNPTAYRFGDFVLEVTNRRLLKAKSVVELNARYFDALVLLVREHGDLVSKDTFFEEVWADVVVSESALTQCIKQIRSQLGDDAADPRFIATVPRHGYRFVAPVEPVMPAGPIEGSSSIALRFDTQAWAREGAAVTIGGALAGMFGGLLYGAGLAYTPGGLGTASVLLVLLSLSMVLGFLGGFGVGFGMSTARTLSSGSRAWVVVGGAIGGLLVGSITKLLGVDGFTLLFGKAPLDATGGLEGAVLGAAVAIGLVAASGATFRWQRILGAGIPTAAAGAIIPAAGGNMLGGSLELLAQTFSESKLELDAMGRFFGELHFGPTTQIFLGGIEGLLFGSFIAVAVMAVARR